MAGRIAAKFAVLQGEYGGVNAGLADNFRMCFTGRKFAGNSAIVAETP